MVADVHIIDDITPEASAMLQALYSRSSDSVTKHLQKVYKSGPDEFMKRYYVGYGHESIGDCGVTSIYIEGVSILACKAIQDWPLYSGQETSTRYINFSDRPILNYLPLPEAQAIQDKWMSFYNHSYLPLIDYLMQKHPKFHSEPQHLWELAINARAFDILRGFLPAGITTQLSWTTNLRQAHDKLKLLRHHPLQEVKIITDQILDALTARYPNSFNQRLDAGEERYLETNAMAMNYYKAKQPISKHGSNFRCATNIDNRSLEFNERDVILNRPRKARLPRHLSRYGHYQCQFLLDFGSFRDLQRHRNGLCQLPLIDGEYGFHNWYLEQLPDKLGQAARELVGTQFESIQSLTKLYGIEKVNLQYLFPLGTNVCAEITYDLPEMVYVTELRSSQSVHPTLRQIAHEMHKALRNEHPELTLHTDTRPDEWSTVRGKQTITEVIDGDTDKDQM